LDAQLTASRTYLAEGVLHNGAGTQIGLSFMHQDRLGSALVTSDKGGVILNSDGGALYQDLDFWSGVQARMPGGGELLVLDAGSATPAPTSAAPAGGGKPGVKFELTDFENLGKPINDILKYLMLTCIHRFTALSAAVHLRGRGFYGTLSERSQKDISCAQRYCVQRCSF